VFFGSWKVFPAVTTLALWGALVIGAVYMTRAIRNILHGPVPEKFATLPDASNAWRKLPYALLLAGLFVFGCFPRLLTDKITPDAQKIVSLVDGGTTVPVVVFGVAPTTFLAGGTPANARDVRALPDKEFAN
jgi:NADH:ubiquinone oxidoreductase subunit 4 (subunit M)